VEHLFLYLFVLACKLVESSCVTQHGCRPRNRKEANFLKKKAVDDCE
jgi:hypothetical protein